MRPDRATSPVLLFTLLVPSLLAALSPAPAAAVEWEVTPQVSYRSDGFELERGFGCVAIYRDCVVRGKTNDGEAYGLTLGAGLRPGWQLELLANRQRDALDARSRLVPVGPGVPVLEFTEDVDLEVTHLQVGVSRVFGAGTVRPFVGVAAGVSQVDLDAAEPDPRELALRLYVIEDASDDAFSASAGGGVKIDLSDHLGLRLEARAWWVDLAEELGGEFTQLDASAGLALRW